MSTQTTRDPGLNEVNEAVYSQIDKSKYDPNQSAEERRDLRVKYRNLTSNTIERRRELVAQDNGDKLYRIISKSNILFENVKNTQEAVLDSRFMAITADINTQKVKNMSIGQENEISLDEFVSKIITASGDGPKHLDDERLDWEHLGKIATRFSKKAHTTDFLLGPLRVEKKQVNRAKTTRVTKNKEDLVRPQQLKEGDIAKQENETSKNVNTIYKILTEVEPINYFRFVTNPESFSQTVENIFYVSFLARSGVVGIDDSTGQPILGLRQVHTVESIDDVISKKQLVMGIDMKDFREIIDTYGITESVIPTRERVEAVARGNGWY
ncbi:Nse4 C-terminal-domain-containing protein [Blakeslea trispora]|nr:Nse4 C-terminal-domain-containing protein [Blakeslea trispora]